MGVLSGSATSRPQTNLCPVSIAKSSRTPVHVFIKVSDQPIPNFNPSILVINCI